MTGFWGEGASWVLDDDHGQHEAGYLRLDASRARYDLGWTPHLRLETALEWLVQWYRGWQSGLGAQESTRGSEMQALTVSQISAYMKLLTGINTR
jgi:CDP-glucose 4,6-dehydratase